MRSHPTVRHRVWTALTLPFLAGAVMLAGCGADAPSPVVPLARDDAAGFASIAPQTVSVGTSAELETALAAANAGTHIHLRAGSYLLSQTLSVADGVTVEGEGVMQFDDAGRPTGFAPGTATTLTMTANVPGNVLTLGNGAAIRRLAVEDRAGRAGNAIAVLSRAAGDQVSASILETEIVNPNPHAIIPQGPTGCGLAVTTQNPNLGNSPPPHEGAVLEVRMARSLIHAPAAGSCGLFAFNFAANGSVSVKFQDDVIGGGMIASGGVSRTDAVHDSRVRVESTRTLYREDHPNACSAPRLGWNLSGGAGTPVPLPLPATTRNTLEVLSVGDRIEGFTTAVLAAGGRRFFPATTAGPSSENLIDLQMLGTDIVTPSCGGVDLKLIGALSSGDFSPGDGNRVRALLRGLHGSGTRANVYANVLGPRSPETQGTGNQLVIPGSQRSFVAANSAIDPAPDPQFFTGGQP